MSKFLVLFSLLFLIACTDSKPAGSNRENTEQSESTTAVPSQNTATAAPLQATGDVSYPTLPLEKAAELFEKTDYMDYVFYELPFSMNHSKKPDIQNSIRYISTSPVTNQIPKCTSIGRIFYQAKGEIIGEAEFHFNDEEKCYYMIFLDEGKPAYANLLTETGVNNYNRIFAQVQK